MLFWMWQFSCSSSTEQHTFAHVRQVIYALTVFQINGVLFRATFLT